MFRCSLSRVVIYLLSVVGIAHARQFLEAPQYTTGVNPQAMAAADFNGDGKTDAVVANSSSNTIGILLGNGDGTFQNQVTYPTGNKPEGVAVADLNGDGKLDIAVTNSGSNTISVFFGNGDGTFTKQPDITTGKQPQGIAIGQLRGTGQPMDLVVTDAGDGKVAVFLGKGDGTFAAHVDYISGFNPFAVVIGDFNNDGKPDLAVANNDNINSEGVSFFQGNGDGTFHSQFQYATLSNPVSIAAGDFNGDGNLDLAVADQQGNAVSVLLGLGNGGFQPHVDYNTAGFPTSVVVGHFSSSGHLDIAATAGNGNTLTLLLGNGDGTFQSEINYGTGDIPYAVAAADFNGDGNTDLAVANWGSNSLSVLLSNGNGTFQTRTDYPVGLYPNAVAVGDFRGIGILDLAVATSDCPSYPSNCGAGTISVVLGFGDGTFQAPNHFATGGTNNPVTDPYALAVADLNGDGKLDLAVANYVTGTLGVMVGNGDGTFQAGVDYPVGGSVPAGLSEPASVAVADLNGDGHPDVVVANFHTNNVSVLLGNGDGTLQNAVNYPVGNGAVSVAIGDFNGDKIPDLVVVNETDNNVSILLGNGDGTFKKQVAYPIVSGGNPLSVVVGDFNGDGKMDLAVADYRTQQVSVLIGNGDGTFQTATQYPTGANPSSVVAADFNGDGKLDLALTSTPLNASPGNLVSLLLGNGDGTFQKPALFGTGSLAYSAAVGDFNGSGAPGLAIANGQSNTVSVLLNTQGTLMKALSSANPSVYGQSVTLTASVGAAVLGSSTPTGSVTFKSGSTILGSGTISGGQVSATTSTLPTGTDTVSAVYSGDGFFLAHTVNITQTVQQASSTTVVLSSVNPSGDGQAVTFTATVAPQLSGTPTGTVNFFDGATQIGSSTLNGGTAGFTVSTLGIGAHSITAAYGGDQNFTASASPALGQTVTTASTSTGLNASSGSPMLTLTANVSSNFATSATPSGSVNFMDGTTQIGSAPLNAGVATLSSIANLTAGTHTFTAVYSGDNTFGGSNSSAVPVTADFGLSASTMSPSSVSPGASATSTVTITPSNGFGLSNLTFTCAVTPAATNGPVCKVGAISGTTATATVTTTPNSSMAAMTDQRPGAMLALGLLLPAMLLGTAGIARDRRKLLGCLFAFLVLGACIFQAACGGGGNGSGSGGGTGGTPAGSYTVTITGSANGVQHNATANLTVQ